MGPSWLSREFGSLFLVIGAILVVPGCREAPSEGAEFQPSSAKDAGFEAVISGTYGGRVSGKGVLEFLPEAGFERTGYFFLADGQGVRAHGVTFVLPPGSGPGRHDLESPSPFEIGTVPSVRVDRDTGTSVVSFQNNTSGFIHLRAFPTESNESDVSGSFEFEAEDAQGQRIRVEGEFSFQAN